MNLQYLTRVAFDLKIHYRGPIQTPKLSSATRLDHMMVSSYGHVKRPPMFSSEQLPLYEHAANLFKGLPRPCHIRIHILEILSTHSRMPVSDLINETGLEASRLSQHLSILRKYGLATSQSSADVVPYRLTHPQAAPSTLPHCYSPSPLM